MDGPPACGFTVAPSKLRFDLCSECCARELDKALPLNLQHTVYQTIISSALDRLFARKPNKVPQEFLASAALNIFQDDDVVTHLCVKVQTTRKKVAEDLTTALVQRYKNSCEQGDDLPALGQFFFGDNAMVKLEVKTAA